jgi:hypothetical protein
MRGRTRRSPIERDHVRESELIASLGGAKVMRSLEGRDSVVGGSQEER